MNKSVITRISDFFINYFSFSGQLVSQEQAEANIREGVSFRGTSIIILILAILIASLGLNTNSTAVIIGAMLISPLMGPIIGIGLGIGIHDYDLIKRCLRNLIMAAGFSVLASTLYFLISPVNEQHSELLARTSPTIYDVLIGFVGGGAGIIALGSTNKGNVIPGVAIATALMPPLCTAGYGLATWQLSYLFGALYLFIINSIYIAFSTFIGVKLMKYKSVPTADPARSRRVMKVVYTLALLTMVPSIYLTYNMLRDNRLNMDADRFIAGECDFPGTQVLARRLFYKDGTRHLAITLIGKPLPIDSLEQVLSPRLKFYGLTGTDLSFFQGGGYERTVPSESMSDINTRELYSVAQATITRQQNAIDSLQREVAMTRFSAEASQQVAPEVHALFPQVSRLGISSTLVSDPATQTSDTVTVALISLDSRLSHSERHRLLDYLRVRLGHPKMILQEVTEL